MSSLGLLHAYSYGKTEAYSRILKRINPSIEPWQDSLNKVLEKNLPPLEGVLKKIDMVLSEDLLSEIISVFTFNLAPGPFTTLIHGDICPDNVFDNREKNELHLIDFEYGSVKSALLDGTYLRMSFPTCWCAKAIPEDLIDSLEASYREQLKKTIPAARSDEAYYDAYAHACAFWMVKSLFFLEQVLEKDDIGPSGPTPPESLWKPEANLVRPRVISRLTAFIEIAKRYKKLPNLLSMAERVLKELEIRWPDATSLDLYPAFTLQKNGVQSEYTLQISYSALADHFHWLDQVSGSAPSFFNFPDYRSSWIERFGISECDHLNAIAKFYSSRFRPLRSLFLFSAPHAKHLSGACYGDHLHLRIPKDLLLLEEESSRKLLTSILVHEATHHLSSCATKEQKEALSKAFLAEVNIGDTPPLNAIEEPLGIASQLLFVEKNYPETYEQATSWFASLLTEQYQDLLKAYLGKSSSIDESFMKQCAEAYSFFVQSLI